MGQMSRVSREKRQFGLGYQPTVKEASKTYQKQFHTIQEIFDSARFSYKGQVAMIGKVNKELPNLVCQFIPDATLNNWKVVEILKIISLFK